MGEKKPPRKWSQPTAERDALRRPPTAPVVAESSAPQTFFDDLEALTPPPHDIRDLTPEMAAIAHSSGVGMEVSDEVNELKKTVKSHSRKFTWWQALILAALGASGTAIMGAAKGLYTKGEKEGAMEVRIHQLELEVTRGYQERATMRDQIDRLRDEIREGSRRKDPEPVRNQ